MRFILAAKWSVLHHVYDSGATDENNEPIDSWADPVAVPVFGWATPGSDAEHEKHRTTVVRDLDVYCPTKFGEPKDQVTVDGDLYDVVGYPEDYNHGPGIIDFQPGYRLNLKRAVELG